MALLTKDELRNAAHRAGMVESHDGRTIRSVGQAHGLTVSDALAWAEEVEHMVVAKQGDQRNTRFRHYKGGIYELVCEATMEADHSALVVYRASDGSIWCRPKSVFFEMVEVDGKHVQRFTAIS